MSTLLVLTTHRPPLLAPGTLTCLSVQLLAGNTFWIPLVWKTLSCHLTIIGFSLILLLIILSPLTTLVKPLSFYLLHLLLILLPLLLMVSLLTYSTLMILLTPHNPVLHLLTDPQSFPLSPPPPPVPACLTFITMLLRNLPLMMMFL